MYMVMEHGRFQHTPEEDTNQAYGEQYSAELSYHESLFADNTNKDSAHAMPTQEEVLNRSAQGVVDAGIQHLEDIKQAQREAAERMDANAMNIYPYV